MTSLRTAHTLGSVLRTEDVVTDDTTSRTFADLMLPSNLVQGLHHAGFIHPSPIQWACLPSATKVGMDLLIQSKSGTGKTLVYVLTAMNMIDPSRNTLQALALVPTREIAVQAAKLANEIASIACPDMKTQTFIGGLPIPQDEARLRKCHFAIGTPGRIQHLITEKYMDVNFVRLVALDEADELIGSKMQVSVVWIFNQLPKTKQVISLSATYPTAVAKLVEKFMILPKHIRLGKECQVLKGAAQYVLWVPEHPNWKEVYRHKINALLMVLSNVTFSQCLVFSNSIIRCDWISNQLRSSGWPTHAISSDYSQTERLKVLGELTEFHCRVLVSTDLTARGVDAQNVNLVVNLDVPHDPETYLHRMGRAGRFGSYGITISVASDGEEYDRLRRFSGVTKSQIYVLNNPKKVLKDLPDLRKIQKIINGEAPSDEDLQVFELLNPLETSEIKPKKEECVRRLQNGSNLDEKTENFTEVDDFCKKIEGLEIEEPQKVDEERITEKRASHIKTTEEYVNEYFERKKEALKKLHHSKKVKPKYKVEAEKGEIFDEVEVEITNSANQDLRSESTEIQSFNNYVQSDYELLETDATSHLENTEDLNYNDCLDSDYVISHYARISGYTPFRVDKEAVNIVRNYLHKRLDEMAPIRKDPDFSAQEFMEKVKELLCSENPSKSFLQFSPPCSRTVLSQLETERLCLAIDYLFNDSLGDRSRDVTDTFVKLKTISDSNLSDAIQNLIEGKEISAEDDNVYEEESISDKFSVDETAPASFTGCIDNYLRKGDELHKFQENKTKKKSKSKDQDLVGHLKSTNQGQTLLQRQMTTSDINPYLSERMNKSEDSERDDLTLNQTDRLSQYGVNLPSDDDEISESRSASLDLLGGPNTFPYPLNNPDELMKSYLQTESIPSWRDSYNSWKERVDANARIIEETIYSNLMRQHENKMSN